MPTFNLEIAIVNDDLEQDPQSGMARLLRETARKVEDGSTQGSLNDENGNQVGTFWMEED